MRLRRLIKTTGSNALYYSGALRVYPRLLGNERRPIILGLHRVVENFQASLSDAMAPMLISTTTLEQYLDWIGQHRKFVPLEEAAEHYDHPPTSGKPIVAVTFDDGYSDAYYHAFPLLRRKGIPFAVFPVTDLVGTEHLQTHDELYLLLRRAIGRWGSHSGARFAELFKDLNVGQRTELYSGNAMEITRLLQQTLSRRDLLRANAALRAAVGGIAGAPHLSSLSWPMIREMHAAGVTIGSHGASHALLTRVPSDQVAAEVSQSKRAIEEKLGAPVTQFVYPDGKFNANVVAELAKSGYKAAYTTCTHRDELWPSLTIPRIMLWEKASVDERERPSPAILECLLGGTLNSAGKCRENHA